MVPFHLCRVFFATGCDLLTWSKHVWVILFWNWTSRRWKKESWNSILELNQLPVMFFFEKFHSGIEPLFFAVLWGKTDLLDDFGSIRTHGYLYTPPARPCAGLLFSFSSFLSRILFLLYGISTLNGGHHNYLRSGYILKRTLHLIPNPKPRKSSPTLYFWRLSIFTHKTTLF